MRNVLFQFEITEILEILKSRKSGIPDFGLGKTKLWLPLDNQEQQILYASNELKNRAIYVWNW